MVTIIRYFRKKKFLVGSGFEPAAEENNRTTTVSNEYYILVLVNVSKIIKRKSGKNVLVVRSGFEPGTLCLPTQRLTAPPSRLV